MSRRWRIPRWAAAALLAGVGTVGHAAGAESAPAVAWKRQLGTADSESSYAVTADGAGNAYISGRTTGSLGGANGGFLDAFLTKYNAAGVLQWTRQVGTTGSDTSTAVTVDRSGNIFLIGDTQGSLGGASLGDYDVFAMKYDAAGTLLWSRQLGSAAGDWSTGAAVDGEGNLLITGRTLGNLDGPSNGHEDAFLAKYDAGGTLQWMRQVGTADTDASHAVAVDAGGNAIITGVTRGDLVGANSGLSDAFVVKFSPSGVLQWQRQVGTVEAEYAEGVAVDGKGNLLVAGWTGGEFGGPSSGSADVFLLKYDAAGALLWNRQMGTSGFDENYGVAVDVADNALICGSTTGSLGGPASGLEDLFVAKYDAAGDLLWSSQLGTVGSDNGQGITLDSAGNAYVTGYTDGNLQGANAGLTDAFLITYEGAGTVPEPGAMGLLAAMAVLSCRRRR